ncbi:MAG: cyclic nucleotide-binding domain-containing protein [Nitrospirae bacterium]|nr:cyclic nucleotide-binding domain-containing protein [Nitrospirota bacterium]
MALDILRKIKLFQGLQDDELREISKLCKEETFTKDAVIFREGAFGDKCYILTKGEIRISKMIPGVGEEALAVLKPGDYFGEMALIDDFPRSAYAIANTDVSLLTISKSHLDELLFFNKEMAFKLLWTFCRTLSERLRETNEKIAAFFSFTGRY